MLSSTLNGIRSIEVPGVLFTKVSIVRFAPFATPVEVNNILLLSATSESLFPLSELPLSVSLPELPLFEFSLLELLLLELSLAELLLLEFSLFELLPFEFSLFELLSFPAKTYPIRKQQIKLSNKIFFFVIICYSFKLNNFFIRIIIFRILQLLNMNSRRNQ
ncbi:MAG: hypothetical protein ACD_79C01090G0004 [uncultured bacterium]|nr:MAG: hypothetical protein ACD_79C01090G0004 [uncultured bacterium]